MDQLLAVLYICVAFGTPEPCIPTNKVFEYGPYVVVLDPVTQTVTEAKFTLRECARRQLFLAAQWASENVGPDAKVTSVCMKYEGGQEASLQLSLDGVRS